MPLAMADVSTERVNDDGTLYVYITVQGGAGSFAPDSFVTKGLASVARALERGSDRFKVTLRTPDEALAAEWLAVLRTACGRQRTLSLEKLQAAIALGDAPLAADMAAGLAELTAAVPIKSRSTLRHSPDQRDSSLSNELSSESPNSAARPSPRVLDVSARVHKPHYFSAESTDDEIVPEVTVVLHHPSERMAAKEQLAVAQQTIVAQRAALQAAHDALLAVGATTAAAAAAAALAAEPPKPAMSTQTGTIVMPATPVAARPGTSGSGGGSASTAEPELAQAVSAAAASVDVTDRGEQVAGPSGAPGVAASDAEAEVTAGVETAARATVEVGANAAAADAAAATSKPAAAGAAPVAQEEWTEEDGKPKAGFSLVGTTGLLMTEGDGREFELRVGPDYKKNGKKAPSAMHTYHPVAVDVIKRKSILFHAASKLTLPPPPDGKNTPNPTGLPRRLVVNCVIGQEAPSMFAAPTDGPCYQVIIVFVASAEALAEWQASGAASCKLWERFAQNAPEGLLPSSGDLDIKERLKLLPKADNMKALNLNWISGYNGKPALLTKSGSVFRGDDYIEVVLNTFRFGMHTRAPAHTTRPPFRRARSASDGL